MGDIRLYTNQLAIEESQTDAVGVNTSGAMGVNAGAIESTGGNAYNTTPKNERRTSFTDCSRHSGGGGSGRTTSLSAVSSASIKSSFDRVQEQKRDHLDHVIHSPRNSPFVAVQQQQKRAINDMVKIVSFVFFLFAER